MNTAERVLRGLEGRQPSTGLAREFYTDAEIYDLDLELIFYREWLFAAHTAELTVTGSYLTLQVGAYPIVLVRAGDGSINAFINSCRHRGARLCPAEKGVAPKLVCPYHQWTYSLDGRLFSARFMGPQFDRKPWGLKRVHCQTAAGYIFVCIAADPPDFAPVRTQFEGYFGPHRFADARVAIESTIIEEGNWKLVWENNRECYHCAVNHPELSRSFPDSPTTTGVTGAGMDPEMVAHWKHCESIGLPSEFLLTQGGQLRTVRVPLLGETRSYTMSGRAAVAKKLSDNVTTDTNIGALVAFFYPSSWNHALIDHGITFRVLPLGPNRTQLTTKWLVHKDAVEGVDYDPAELTHVWRATNEQDRRIVRENQIGIDAPTYEPGPFCLPQESGVAQFVDWYTTLLQHRLEEVVNARAAAIA
jgi:Rieske 2Fe-2S family protein